ncbi:hypothetical protein FA048_18390 [Pedobacter polaris]|uniref:Lipoprotein n=1 Tax=Pedobacter polaris TaxID=2571273 RepID=A0A4U1CF95_9SPHI|nr:hypothetical protein [Pedobacter polaris]TKC05682.1 hypothetical protein FA048_18390 [Pedobacter polaris]
MKKIFLGVLVCLGLACSEAKQDKVENAIAKTSDSLNSKLNKLNDTLNKVKDDVANKIPKVKIEIERSIPISLQWISFENQGKATLSKENDGWFTIKGEQTNTNNEFLKINGKIKRVDQQTISFEGTIITYIKTNNGGAPCEKTGKQVFSKKGERRYYRLQNMENCAGGRLLDYVDLYDLDNKL